MLKKALVGMGKNIISKLHSIVFTESRDRLEWSASYFIQQDVCMQFQYAGFRDLIAFASMSFEHANTLTLTLLFKVQSLGKNFSFFLLVSPQFQKFQLSLKVHMAARVECTIRVSREMENCVHKLTTL